LTVNQFQLLKAIAKEYGVKQYSSKDFIGKYKLGTSSSVNRSLKMLLDKEMIYEEMGVYKVYDLFFANWLTKK
jgi:RIO-like serine/threonine protein kinase